MLRLAFSIVQAQCRAPSGLDVAGPYEHVSRRRTNMLNDRDAAFGRTLAVATLIGCAVMGCKKTESAAVSKGSGEPAIAAAKATGEAKPADGAVDPAMLAAVKTELDRAYQGTEREPPKSAAKPTPGKKVWIISPGQIGESASIATNAAKEAGELIGWKMTLYDSKLDVANFSLGIRQAVAAQADGVILHSIDCPLVKQALAEARAAKVKIVAYYALDCDDPSVKGQPMYDASVNFGSQFGDYAALTRAWGAAKADWVITRTKGRAKVISFKEDELLVVKYIREGFEEELAKCKSCEIVKTVDFTLQDLGPKLQQRTPRPTRSTCRTTRRSCSASPARSWSRAATISSTWSAARASRPTSR